MLSLVGYLSVPESDFGKKQSTYLHLVANMETLTVILYDIKNRVVEWDEIYKFADAYHMFNTLTDEYERRGWLMVKEEKVSTNTFVREFATVSGGHVFDLILCDGRVENVNKIN
jgi:hypothetical protein